MSGWPDDESVLARFRQWLDEAHAEAETIVADGGPLDREPESHAIGLFQVIEEFTALRHELKLQTKSARSLDERTVDALEALEAATGQFRSVEPREREAAKPLVEALVELDDALRRGRAVIETARQRILEESPRRLQERLDELWRKQPWWKRWVSRPLHEAALDACSRHAAELHREILDSFLEGYRLIQGRLAKAMDKEEILRMDCVGKPADPNSMTVVEVVHDPSRPPGTVVEEVRPGYYWKSKVFRFAEVRAVQGGRG
jgi:molecular chaperone GrpE